MALDLEKLLVSLEANLKQYEKEMARANSITVREMRRVEKVAQGSVANVERVMGNLGATIRAGLGGAAAAAALAFGVAIKSAISDAAKIGDVADKIGITTGFLQELQYGAVQADLGFEELSGSLTRFSRLLGDAQSGQGELLALFEANGLSKAAVQAMSYAEALRTVADLVRNAKNEQDQLQVATAAFGGKAGDAMLEFLRGGSEGLLKFGDDARAAGAVIDDALIKKAQDLDDRWAALMQSLKMRTQSAVLSIVDDLSKIGEVDPNFMSSRGPSRPRQARSFGLATYPRVSGPGSAGGPNEFAAPPRIYPSQQTVIPDAEAERERQRAEEAAARERERAAAEALRQREAELKAIDDVISALEFEHAQLGRNSLAQEIAAQQRQAGVTAASAEGKAIAELVTRNYELAQAQAAAKDAQEAQIAAAQDATEKFAEQQAAMRDSLQQLGQIGFDAFSRIVQGGEKASDVLLDVANQIANAALQATILGTGPLAGLFGGNSGSGGLLGQLLGAFQGGGVSAGIYHAGGVVGPGGPSRTVAAATFAGAPRYHKGGMAGLRPGEMPAILQPGEVVLPRGMRMGGQGQQTIIYDQRKNAPAIERQKGSDGRLRLFIRDEITGVIGGGQADGVMGGRFGVRPAPVRR